VFIVGLEEGVLPHSRSMEEPDAMQEERRLMYVGLTRAKDRVFLIYAFRRSLYGGSNEAAPSRFLYDIPRQITQGTALPSRGGFEAERHGYRAMIAWDRAISDREAQRAAAKPTRFKAGDCVYHRKFGEGVVVSSNIRGELEEVDVLFPGGDGQKTIIADFLSPMDDA
jgi:DNA helicase-2/ATP-dependent DNA helicase PcrA